MTIKNFHHFLYGREFEIKTDHRPLVWLNSVKDPTSRLVRWRLKLMNYQYKIKYIPGKMNHTADLLSRPILLTLLDQEKTYEDFQMYNKQNKMRIPIEETSQNINIIPNILILVPKDLKINNKLREFILDKIDEADINLTNEGQVLHHETDNQSLTLIITKKDSNHKINKETLYNSLIETSFTNHRKITLIYPENINKDISEQYLNNLLTYTFNDSINIIKVNKLNCDTLLTEAQIQEAINKEIQNLSDISIPDNFDLNIEIPSPTEEQPSCSNEITTIEQSKEVPIEKSSTIIIKTEAEKKQLLIDYHDSPLRGHPGTKRTYDELRKKYFWKGMKTYVEKYIKNCKECQTSKPSKINKAPMVITTTAKDFNEEVSMDFVGPLPRTNNQNVYMLTIQDNLTKFLQVYPMPDRTAETTAIYFLKFASTFGFPKMILTDQDPVFKSALIKELNKFLTIGHKMTSPYHPQTNGSLERSHSYLESYLRSYVNSKANNWDELLYLATYSYNTHVNRSTQELPYTLVFGIDPNIPNSLNKESNRQTYHDLLTEIKENLKTLRQTTQDNLIESKQINKQYYDKKAKVNKKPFEINDQVLVKEGQFGAGKLAKRFKGPFKVIKTNPELHTVTVKFNRGTKTYHENNLKHFVSDVVNINPVQPHHPFDGTNTGRTD